MAGAGGAEGVGMGFTGGGVATVVLTGSFIFKTKVNILFLDGRYCPSWLSSPARGVPYFEAAADLFVLTVVTLLSA